MVTQRPQQNAVFRAIADPTRRKILSLLRGQRLTVGEIAGHFHTSRPAISKHLRMLRTAGLVTTRQRGTAHLCALRAAPLRGIAQWLHDYETLWDESLRRLKTHIEENP